MREQSAKSPKRTRGWWDPTALRPPVTPSARDGTTAGARRGGGVVGALRRGRSFSAVVTVLVVASAPSPAAGEDGEVAAGAWTLAAAVERALATHPSIAAAEAEIARARAGLAAAEAARRPDASLSASAFRYQEPTVVTPFHGFTAGEVPEFDTEIFQAGAGLSYLLWDGGGRASRIDHEARGVAAAESASRDVRQRLAATTVEAYLSVLVTADTAAAHDHRIASLEAERSRVRLMLEAGRAAEVDLRRVQAALAAARAEQVALTVGLDRAERELARLLDAEVDAVRVDLLARPATRATEPPERADAATTALASNPAVARAEQQLAAAEAALAAARAARRPALRLEGNLLGFGSPDVDPTTEWNAGLRVAVPLFDGALDADVAGAEAARDGAAEALDLARRQVESEVDGALATIAETLARAESLEEATARWSEVVRVERLRLANGVGIESDYLEAEADLLSARAAAAEARFGIVGARAELARIEGVLTADWLAGLAAGGEGDGGNGSGSETR